jgi:sensor domain DACNV-containing protein/DisA checkpoint controller-like protein
MPMLSPTILERICTAWSADQAHPYRGRRNVELPVLAALHCFVDTVFLASLREEEGKSVNFSAVLVGRQEGIESVSINPSALLVLEEPVPFTSSILPKFAAAFDPKLSTIAVESNEADGNLYIWGVFQHAQKTNILSEVSDGIPGNSSMRPDFFTLTTRGRGSFAVSRGRALIGRFQAGYFVAASPTPFMSKSLGAHVLASIVRDPLYTKYNAKYWHFIRPLLDLLLEEASLRGHGATIVILEADRPSISGHYESKHRLIGEYNFRETIEECLKNDSTTGRGIAYRRVACENIQRIAQLATVDGALVIDSLFNVLAFGATLTAPRADRSALIGPDGFGNTNGQAFDVSRYGTRHRSAFDFAAANHNSTVFVISQDGPIRAFRADGDRSVLVWPDCNTSMYV